MMCKLYCGAALVVGIAMTWWAKSEAAHSLGFYVLMTILWVLLTWVACVFLWHWGMIVLRSSAKWLLCLCGVAHRGPDPHMPEWDEKVVRVRRWGPVKDHWWSAKQYYVSIEYYVCRHAECRAFKIIRVIKDA